MKKEEKLYIKSRVSALRFKAAQKYNISPSSCHIGHLVLQGMLDEPENLNQIDGATDARETNLSVATRSMRLASAMNNYGLKPGDPVIVMGPNHLDMAIPYYACHYGGFPLCGMDPHTGEADLKGLFPYIRPKMMFCHKANLECVKKAFAMIEQNGKIIVFDDDAINMESFIQEFNGTEVNYRPNEFDHSKIPAWLILTSGTTGMPKVAVIPYDTLLNGIISWWEWYHVKIQTTLSMSTFQWLSSLVFFISGPLRSYTRLQLSVPLTPQLLVMTINKYRPDVTAWTPHLLGQFLQATEKICDLTCFKCVIISGSPMEKPILENFQKRCPSAFLYLVYGMTELLVPGFDYTNQTPFGSVGKPYDKYEYKLVNDEGQTEEKPFKTGELWIKGDVFFRGYLNNPEETKKMITDDGWFKTGDMFYRDDDNNYYFVERQRLLIKSAGYWISPLQLEEVIKKHPAVNTVCVVGIPDKQLMEVPVAAIVRKNGQQFEPEELFKHINDVQPEFRRLHGGYFFLDALPVTASGKVHRTMIKEIALKAERILPSTPSKYRVDLSNLTK
ncbi:luciferin 4-monooxygenase-like [Plodia interpunctella]|uniref:luciferin 4-monooxygenase-like n=1 Tax=Plodia interpunctella TaxID=58824 RepID=UPI002367E8D6|nr:luciferin 4-monooxygenase-like [Plodia interpunctella]